jgi:deazaflavin-dependent oxidoreductase (nitroreductase family)
MSEQKASSNLPQWIFDHIELYKRDPEKAHLWDSSLGGSKGMLTTLLLTTRGRKSGNDVSIPLIYSKYGNAFVVIASKGGAPNHPDWYKNLLANPECDLQVSTKAYKARARTATGEERAKLWKQMQALYPPYDDYQKRAPNRQIPVVVLEPVATK